MFLKSRGLEAWLVGGCVRDQLMGIEPYDIDLAVDSSHDEMISLFPGIRFRGREGERSYYILHKNHVFEIVLLEGRSLYADLARRDFTINAMAMDVNGSIIDPFQGRRDLEIPVLKFNGSGRERIEEDPSRILRFCRFAAYPGMKVDPSSSDILKNWQHSRESIAQERIGAEILRSINLSVFSSFLDCVRYHGLIDLIASSSQSKYDIISCIKAVSSLESERSSPAELCTAFLYDLEPEPAVRMGRWCWPVKLKKEVCLLIDICRAINRTHMREEDIADTAVKLRFPGIAKVRRLVLSGFLPPEKVIYAGKNLLRVRKAAENLSRSVDLPDGKEIMRRLDERSSRRIGEIRRKILLESARGNMRTNREVDRFFETLE